MKKYIIALDQGTTSSRAIIFDKEQNILDVSQKEFTQIYPNAGWVEHNPLEIWASQYGVLQEVMAKTNITQEEIAAIGITNQRETTIVWDKNTGEPVYNAIVWQCRRTAAIVEELKKDTEFNYYIRENTGLLLDAYLAGLAVGFWESKEEIAKAWSVSQAYTPNLDEDKKEKLYRGWKKAVERAKGWLNLIMHVSKSKFRTCMKGTTSSIYSVKPFIFIFSELINSAIPVFIFLKFCFS